MRFQPNPNFARELHQEVLYREGLRQVAEGAAEEVSALAHRIMPRGRGEQIVVEADGEGVRVANQAYGAAIDEVGSRNSIAYAPLRRGVRAAGLDLRES